MPHVPKNPKTARLNWSFEIKCVDCGSVLIVESVDPTVERLPQGVRLVMMTIPNECPDCHNLRVVKKGT